MVKVSIIIPVMNVEKYLRECIESAINQTLYEIEIICIDDGSTDASSRILDEYANIDDRIIVIHKENTGYGNSMNIGIDRASGEYIAILESDDFVDKNMYRDLYEIASENDLDFIKSNFVLVEGEKGKYSYSPAYESLKREYYNRLLSREEINELFKGWMAHWSAIYKKAFLDRNKIRYNETPGASYQDTGFWFQIMVLAKKVMICGEQYYYYRIDNPSSSMNNSKKVFCITQEYDYLEKKLTERGILKEFLPQYTLMRYIGHKYTIKRIADRFKKEFILKTAEGFNELNKRNLLDFSEMDEENKNIINLWMKDPEEFYDEVTFVERKIDEYLPSSESIYIYGAGFLGKRIYENLSDFCREKFVGFIVTKASEENLKVYSQPVYSIEEVVLDEKSQVIIGVTGKYLEEVIDTLIRKNIKNYCIIPEKIIRHWVL